MPFRAIWPFVNNHENKAVQIMLKNQMMSIKFISAKFLIYACSHLALSFGTVTFLLLTLPVFHPFTPSAAHECFLMSLFLHFSFSFFSFFHFFWYKAEVKGNSCPQKHIQAPSPRMFSESLVSKPQVFTASRNNFPSV